MATATPRKTNVTAIVPNISICVACSQESKQRYYILSKSGSEGPSYHVAENFYHVSFKSEVNNDSFLCKRLLQRILDMEEQTQKLVQKVNQSSQELNVRVSQKRCITLTRNNRDKRGLEHFVLISTAFTRDSSSRSRTAPESEGQFPQSQFCLQLSQHKHKLETFLIVASLGVKYSNKY